MKDMSRLQFDAALKRNGMRWVGFMGYVDVGRFGKASMCSICAYNGGCTYRAMLAYLLRERDRLEATYGPSKGGAQ